MKFGMPTLVECRDIYECNRVAVENGLDFIEINMSFPVYGRDNLDLDDLCRLRDETGVGYTIHADELLNPFDFNKKVSLAYFDVMRDTIYVARKIGAPVINMHLLKGVYSTLPGKVIMLNDVYFDEYRARVKEFIVMCESEIGDSGVRIAIENVDTNPFTEAQRAVLSDFLSSPVFGLTLDVGHDECLSHRDIDVYDSNPEQVIHMHLHDSDGKSAHLPFGAGRVNAGKCVERLVGGETCLIEVKTAAGLAESIEYLKAQNIM